MSNEIMVKYGMNGDDPNHAVAIIDEPPVFTLDNLPLLPLPPVPEHIRNNAALEILNRFRKEDIEQMHPDIVKSLWMSYQNDIEVVMDNQTIDVLMPCQEGRYINQKTTQSLDRQGYKWRLWVSTLHSNGNHHDARNQVKDYGNSSYVFFLDNDLELPDHALKAMVHFLMQPENQQVASVAIRRVELNDNAHYGEYDGTADYPNHVGMSCNLWRREVLQQMTFEKRGGCECKAMCEDLRNIGYEIGILRGPTCKHLKSKM